MTEPAPQFSAALGERYRIQRELGRGGMATVYLAEDVRHERPVALKVLHLELGLSLGPERFQREIKLAARLQHPHILTVHDSGETAGWLWYTMPFVEGESVRDRLRREGQLPLEEALRIAREVAQALSFAHEHGVIHRDIKPENILLARDGSALVADFGIARAFVAGEARLTETGLSLGTPAYMSPEQASGDRSVDPRTDIYSLGAVLYEMLAGEPPFTGPTAQAIIMKRFAEPAPDVRRVRPSVPREVEEVVRHALAPLPADRFATGSELARALQSAAAVRAAASVAATALTAPPQSARGRRPLLLAGLALMALVLGVAALFASRHRRQVGTERRVPRVVAVLPFENLGDSSMTYFADGVADEIRSKLSRVAGLEVIARTSSNEYRRSTKRPQEIARELDADYLLMATVRWEKDPRGGASRVRVTPELVEAIPRRSPRTRWSQPFDAALTDVFQVQAAIANQVAGALDIELGDSARRELAAKPTADIAAYDAYLKGEAASEAMAAIDPASLRRAIGFYARAVALDSAFVSAWAQLARARSNLYLYSTPVPTLAAEAKEAAERAQALRPDRPESQLALGDYLRQVRLDLPRALAAYRAGLALAPSDADLLAAAGVAEQSLGRWEVAFQDLAQAAALDPRSATTARRVGVTLLCLRRYPEAAAALDRAIALVPTSLDFIQYRAMIAVAEGDLPEARGVINAALARVDASAVLAYFANYQDMYWVLDDAQQRELLTLSPNAFDDDIGVWALVRAETYSLRGKVARARVYADSARLAFEEQLRAAPDDGQRRVVLGLSLAYLGRKAEAIAQGRRGMALWTLSRDAYYGAYVQLQLVRIYLLVGKPEEALDLLEPLLRMPGYLSPGWLRIDPTFAPLKGNPRFEKLIARTSLSLGFHSDPRPIASPVLPISGRIANLCERG